MCSPATLGAAHHAEHRKGVSRRSFFKTGAAAAAAGATLAAVGPALPALAGARPRATIDLTHRLVKSFPSFFGAPVVSCETLFDYDPDGFLTKEWTLEEHIGTHIDAPGHFAQGEALVDEMDASALVAPIVVVDIKDKAADDPNATVDVADLNAWESNFGRIPHGALVAMNSGWDAKVDDGDEFRGGTGFPDLNFPGFSVDATDWLLARRGIVGIACDTMSLDPGNSADFAVHFSFLAAGGYGIESIANLDAIPVRGATAFVGSIPWEGGSGSPVRVIAVY